MYSRIVSQHAIHPQNRGALATATAHGEASYPPCGDRFFLHLRLETDVIQEATFEAQACGPVVAAGSLGTCLITGMPVEQALQLNCFQIDRLLGGLPPSKRHAILLFLDSLHQALAPQSELEISRKSSI